MKHHNNLPRPIFLKVVILLISFTLSACSPSQDPTSTPIIEREKAVNLAIMGCRKPHLVLVGDPTNIQTKLLSLDEADQLTSVDGEKTNYGKPMNTKVWLVQMEGELQLVGGPQPVVTMNSQPEIATPPQSFFGTCIAVLDASSGDLIFIRDKPNN